MVNFDGDPRGERRRRLAGIPAALWRWVVQARHRLLMLDYDGTLAPFAVARADARPSPETIALLQRIAASPGTTLAIVSGRRLDEIEALMADVPATLIGEHGWERRRADGTYLRIPLDPATAATLAAAVQAARAGGWGERLEQKRSAVVLHTRGLPEAHARELEERGAQAWQPLVSPQVALDRIRGGVELRARGRNKGTAVLSLLSHAPRGTLGVFVGDDVTDEDAFEAVHAWGFGVRVGDGSGPSVAQARLGSIGAVAEFLAEWLRLTAPPLGEAS